MDREQGYNPFTDPDFYRSWFRQQFAEYREEDLLRAMGTVRVAQESGLTVKDLADTLGEQLLIVSGNKELANTQLAILIGLYQTDKESWNTKLDEQLYG